MEQLKVIRTLKELKKLEKYLVDKDFISLDTETTGVDKSSEIIGYSVCAETDVAYYVVIAEWLTKVEEYQDKCTYCYGEGKVEVAEDDRLPQDDERQVYTVESCPDCEGSGQVWALKHSGELRYLETKGGSKEFFNCLVGKNLVLHNAVFDCSMIQDNFGVSLIDHVHTDTMLLAHLLNENRPCGLKELALMIFGEDSVKEQTEMKESVTKNGGTLTKNCYELYKGDSELIAKYGAKDTILTLKLFYHMVPELFEQNLNKFFYEDETMPLLRTATYTMNTEGLKVDTDTLQTLRCQLEADIMEAKAFIYKEITPSIKDKYPGTTKATTFNIGSNQQLAWLLFERLGQPFHALTDEGKVVCKHLGLKAYSLKEKREFVRQCTQSLGQLYIPDTTINGKLKKGKKIGEWWKYAKADKETLAKYADRYQWVKKFQTYNKDLKLLNTYVEGIQERMKYGVIRPSFLQHGTTSGRYSSRNPNFQNLPRNDTRIKSCIVARPGKVFVGADQSQLEVRVFAALSQDAPLLASFQTGEDFYSVIGMTVFGKADCTPYKDGSPDAFGIKYKTLRDVAKVVALSATYGTTAPKMAPAIGKSIEESQEIIDEYFNNFPGVRQFQLDSHTQAKAHGVVANYFGRPRRMPAALNIPKRAEHSNLTYEQRNLLNLAVNHRVQSTAASVMNRCAVAVHAACIAKGLDAKIVLQVHDELILECPEGIAEQVAAELKDAMENTVTLPGVGFIAEPKIAYNLKDLK